MCLRRGLLVATGVPFSLSLSPPFPSCSSVRKARGHCRSWLGVPRARVPLSPAHRCAPLGCVPFSACGFLLVVWLPCSVVCPGFRPALLVVSEFTQVTIPAHAYALRCLSLLAVLRDFPVHSRCIHSYMDQKTSYSLPFPVASSLSAVSCMSVTVHCFPGFCLHYPPVFN